MAVRDPAQPASPPQPAGSGESGERERRVPASSQVIKGTAFKVAWAKDNSA